MDTLDSLTEIKEYNAKLAKMLPSLTTVPLHPVGSDWSSAPVTSRVDDWSGGKKIYDILKDTREQTLEMYAAQVRPFVLKQYTLLSSDTPLEQTVLADTFVDRASRYFAQKIMDGIYTLNDSNDLVSVKPKNSSIDSFFPVDKNVAAYIAQKKDRNN